MRAHGAEQGRDRGLYVPAALATGVLVVLGFGPSYFYRPFTNPTTSLTTLVHMHGALMTTWIALFLAQAALVSARRVDLHRRLGRLGFVLLTLIVAVSLPMAIVAAKLGGDHMPGPPLPGLALVFGLLIEFVTLAGLGLHYRTRSDIHKRLMLLAAFAAMEAGVSRLPIDFLQNIVHTHVVNDSLLLVVVAVDSIRHRRVHPAFLSGTIFLVSVQASAMWVAGTEVWARISQSIVSTF
jgi:hypothetical protein